MAVNIEIISANESEYNALLKIIGDELEQGKQHIATAINNAIVVSYLKIGQHIVEFEQKGHEKAEYGSELLSKLSKDLTDSYGKGFSISNVYRMRQIYLVYPIFATVSQKLT